MLLTIPDLIDDYNHNMNGVDLADQLRASYHTHLRGVRNWLPLFYWLVDTIKVNSYLIWRMHYPQVSHKEFQLEVSKQLTMEGLEQHQTQLMQEKAISSQQIYQPSGQQFPGLPPSQSTPLGAERHQIDNAMHCLAYIHKKKRAQVRKCVCKKYTAFHCIHCQNALCTGTSNCVDRYACSFILVK